MPKFLAVSLSIVMVCSVLIISGSIISWETIKDQYREDAANSLETRRDNNFKAFLQWANARTNEITTVSKAPALTSIVENFSDLMVDEHLAEHPVQQRLSDWFHFIYENLNLHAYYLIDENGIVLSANEKAAISSPLTILDPLEVKRLFSQKNYINLDSGIRTKTHLKSPKIITGAPLNVSKNATQTKMALVFVRQWPEQPIPGLNPFQKTGKVFLVNRHGNKITLPTGQLSPAAYVSFSRAITHTTHLDLSGNVIENQTSVVSASHWYEPLNIGIHLEVSYQEMFQTLQKIQLQIIVITAFSCLLLTCLVLYFIVSRTKLKTASKETLQSEARLKLALEASNEGIWDWNLKNGEVFFSANWYTMLGYSITEEKQTLKRLTDLIHPDDKNEVIDALVKNAAWGDACSQEFRLRSKNQGYRWIQIVGNVAERGPDNNPQRIIHTQRDITDKKIYEEKLEKLNHQLENLLDEQSSKLEETQAELEQILQCSGDGILGIGLNGNILFCNPVASLITGYSAAELMGRCEHTILHHHSADGHVIDKSDCRILQSISSASLTTASDEVFWRKDGSSFPVEYTSAPLIDKNGEVTGVTVIFRDITERKEVEVAQKKAILAANEASAAKSHFLANISHEIRTPMNAIIGLTDTFSKTPLSSQQHGYLNTIKTSANRLLAMINDILDFSKIEQGSLQREDCEFDFDQIIANIADLFSHATYEKNLLFLIEKDPGIPSKIVSDATKLGQILTNLLSNAVKFTNEGRIRLSISRATENLEDKILFHISDTGVGITEDDQENIFSAFTQADNSSTRKYEGAGLGLAISQQLVNLMGGDLSIQSTAGQGTDVRFSVHLSTPSETSLAPIQETSMKWLLISDDHHLRDNLRHWLHNSGYHSLSRSVDYLVSHLDDLKQIDGICFDWSISDEALSKLLSTLSSLSIDVPLYEVRQAYSAVKRTEKISSHVTGIIGFPITTALNLTKQISQPSTT